MKTTSSKSRKKEIFPKGLTHGFGQKMAIFPCFFKRKYRPGKCVLRYSRTKNRLFQPIKTRSLKTLKTEIFSKGLTMVFVKNGHFSIFFFWKYRSENVFYDILERKNAFVGHKNKKFREMCFSIFQNEKTLFQPVKTRSSKSRKIEIFPKGITHDFGQKMAIFPCFFYKKYSPRKCVLRYSRTKKRVSTL